MVNVVENLRHYIKNIITKSLESSIICGELPWVGIPEILIEVPREKEHGEFSTNIAMQITKVARKAPKQIAEILMKNMILDGTSIEKIECAGPGFINFFLKNDWLFETLRAIQSDGEDYGRINLGNGRKVMVEFVSANPTGPLHMGNARGGALGDCIASVLEASGYCVTKEFYINDAGNQIDKFGISLEARYIQLLKGEDAIIFPEDGYQGEDITGHMRDYIAENGDKLLEVQPGLRRKALVEYALPKNLDRIKNGLESYGVKHDVWFSEKSLYDSGELSHTIELLKKNDCVIEKEGALWLKASVMGVEKDEVIIRNNGLPTYFATDIAYHRNKFQVRNFDWVINLWGADHHGHVARMKGAVAALGMDPEKLDVVLFQLVRLYRNGEIARMSKRTGKSISLADLMEELSSHAEEIGRKNPQEVGRDAARFIFNTKASGSHLDFDLDLAVQQSNENPVFYVQYAHARICSILNPPEGESIIIPKIETVDLTLLQKKEEIDLIKKLAELPEEVRISAQTLEPSRLTRYVYDVAGLFHSFYSACRVKIEDTDMMNARIILVDCTRTVIKNTLNLLSISAPEKM